MNSESLKENFYNGELSQVFNPDNLKDMISSKDLIGVVLRIHFCLEEFLNLWCNKITGCEDFFDFNITFNLKLKISQKLGLPSELKIVFDKFNSIRNQFAHRKDITSLESKLNDICYKIDEIPTNISESPLIVKVKEAYIVSTQYEKKFCWDTPDISNIQKILLLYFAFKMKTLRIFYKEFSERGLSFSYVPEA